MTPGPDEIRTPGQEDGEPFLSRWSRRKKEARNELPQPAREKAVDPESPPPDLPPIDQLTPESDFRAFFHPKVDENVRRAALKKLFSDPHFNVMDGLDTYIDDYSKTEPIPAAMLAGLKQAQNILRWAQEDTEKRAQDKLEKEAAARELDSPASPKAPEAGAQATAPVETPAMPGDARDSPRS